MDKNPNVDEYLNSKCADFALPLIKQLREIYLSEGLVEEFKWSAPCYSHQGLVCSLGAFKKHVASWFFKGVLLNDPEQVLRKAQKDTKGLRSLYYTEGDLIDELQVRTFVREAMILNEQEISVPKAKPVVLVPTPEMTSCLDKHPQAKQIFEQLSSSRQKEYIRWISEAKRESTRQSRLEKMLVLLADGKGLNDKYRKT